MPPHRQLLVAASLVVACARPAEPNLPDHPAPPTEPVPAATVDPEIAELNLDFEIVDDELPAGWNVAGNGYTVGLDPRARSGNHGLEIAYADGGPKAFGVASRTYPVERARGHRLVLRGHLSTEDVREGFAGLWMRVDGEGGKMLAFDNMADRGATGTTEWQAFEVILDVPPEATGVVFGALLTGKGVARVDGLSFERRPIPVLPEEVEVAGTVVGPDDQPVAGAHMAVMPAPFGEPIATGTTDAKGSFSFTVPRGEYRLTVSAPDLLVHSGPANIHKPTTIELEAGGTTIEGRVLDEDGVALPGAGIWMISTDFLVPPVYTRANDSGHYAISVHPDQSLVLSVDSDAVYGGYVQVRSDRPRTLDLPASRREPAPKAVVDEIRRRAIPLSGVTAGAGFEDMEPLRKVVGKARVVGLGEATHGTREFFQMKHRMLELLVERMGFTVFAIEASFSHTMVVNDYVLHGKGSADDGLEAMQFWTWDTEEVRELIEWMRAYNLDPKHTTKLEFLGFDMQAEEPAAEIVATYLGEVDPDFQGVTEALDASPKEVVARFDRNRKAYVARSSLERWQRARQHAVVYGQWKEMKDGPRSEAFDVRDRSMAANVRWLLDTKPRGTKIVLWAHNGHVGRELLAYRTMGRHLKEALGDRYRIFGFSFGDGGFRAIDSRRGLKEWELGEPPPESFDAALRRADCSVCVLDLRSLPRKGALARWLSRARLGRDIGAVFTSEENTIRPFAWPQTYDAVIYVDHTTPSRPAKRAQ